MTIQTPVGAASGHACGEARERAHGSDGHTAVCACGWASKPAKTQNLADYARRRHSCETYAQRVAMNERAAARLADTGPRRACQHRRARHEHGTHAAYALDRCRCRPCRDAASQYERWRCKQRAYGRQSYVDASRARDHVRSLMSQGLGLKRIVILSGVPQGVLWKLVYGKRHADGTQRPSRRIRPATETALLAVSASLDNLGSTVCVDATGTRRRLQALATLGWSQSQLARRLDIIPTNFCKTVYAATVHADTARKVRALYDELWKVRPPESTQRERIAASRSRNRAAANGWKPPLWWDEDEIDTPVIPDQPTASQSRDDFLDEIAVERAMTGVHVRLTKTERAEVVRRLVAAGVGPTEIARRLALSGTTINLLLTSLLDEIAAGA